MLNRGCRGIDADGTEWYILGGQTFMFVEEKDEILYFLSLKGEVWSIEKWFGGNRFEEAKNTEKV